MESVVSSLFYLVLRVLFKLVPNTIDKGLEVPKILLEKSFELWPCDQSGVLMMALVLSPSKPNNAMEKSGGKRGIIYPCGTRYLKIIFTLLTKMVAVYVGSFRISFQGPNLK